MNINFPQEEKKVLKFWKDKKIFEKSLKLRKDGPVFSFYDGPPFATGQPHYGHILVTAIKDAVLRFWTMQGYYVPRRVGWDCHGLPVENLIEKEVGLKSKKDIEEYGIEKFNTACGNSVFRCVTDFQETLKRVGRWADYSNSYSTMNNNYIESVWWVLKELDKNKLVYKDFRVSPYCPRCGTPLSNFELNQPGAYQDVEDISIYVKFKLKDEDASLLIWTTTPWTLPSNMAVAVGEKIKYVKVKFNGENLILAKERLSILEGEYSIEEEMTGKDLVGKSYLPLYGKTKGDIMHKVSSAEFVSTEDGSGLVHIAPAFGVDDMELGKKIGIESKDILIKVDAEGKITLGDNIPGEDKFVKTADKEIRADLKERGILFKEEPILHSYPHCWRCDTPLLYYPIDSWYISVTQFKDQLVKNNKKEIKWVPENIKEGRFGKWLEGARDWSFSRNRFWGAPIPIWECSGKDCNHKEVIGGVKDIIKQKFTDNTYFITRHGETNYQAEEREDLYPWPDSKKVYLSEKGKKDILKNAKELKKKKIDIIYSSDLYRTKQTAEIISKETGAKIVYDKGLRDIFYGDYHNGPRSEYRKDFSKTEGFMSKKAPNGESIDDCRKRVLKTLEKIDKKHKGQNIVIVSHGDPSWIIYSTMKGISDEKMIKQGKDGVIRNRMFNVGEMREIKYSKMPLNKEGRFDFHKPYIDNVVFSCPKCEGKMKRVPEVFDCWFESGSMPYAQWHYPFENKKLVESMFPADFIAEAIDQTRGWFYTLHVISTALTLKDGNLGKNKPAFKNVITNGLVLAENGKKLSKRLKNYPDPSVVFDTYGADALRYFLLASTPIGEDYLFSEKRISDLSRRINSTLWNSFVFFDTYSGFRKLMKSIKPTNILDRWIVSKLNTMNKNIVDSMKKYELTKATREFDGFIDDLSNWYIRRSRKRLQGEAEIEAEKTLYFVLLELSKMMAPFMPFISEELYQKLAGPKESVHLDDYPKTKTALIDTKLEENMFFIRQIATAALAERQKAGIKVRQPLQTLKIKEKITDKELLGLIKDEINVKEVVYDKEIKEDVWLDTNITASLKAEGTIRELIRNIQSMRKKTNLKPTDKVMVQFHGGSKIISMIEENEDFLISEGRIKKIGIGDRPKEVYEIENQTKVEGEDLWIGLKVI
jgi:isoleucyl-tRNA synthetase